MMDDVASLPLDVPFPALFFLVETGGVWKDISIEHDSFPFLFPVKTRTDLFSCFQIKKRGETRNTRVSPLEVCCIKTG